MNPSKQIKRFVTVFAHIVFLMLLSCSTTYEPYTASDPQLNFPYYPDKVQHAGENSERARVFPWEVWTPGKDLDGLPITNFAIMKGDDIAKSGRRQEAITHYKSIDRRSLLPQEEEALVFRIASNELSLGRAKESLNVLSQYFTKRNESPDFVNPAFAILLGYAYGYNQNFEQSLAWFSRVNKLNSNNRAHLMIATTGAKEFLSRIPAENFETVSAAWAGDPFIRSLIAEERVLRSQRGVVGDNPIWAETPGLPPTAQPGGLLNVGIVLPTSGKYAVLGNSTRNGLDMAIGGGVTVTDAGTAPQRIELHHRDTAGNPQNLSNHMTEMANVLKPALVIGPLLSELAVTAGEFSRQSRIPLLTFSKKSGFATGGGVFRLGATAESQVETLLSKVTDQMNLSNFALIYANDLNGQDFAAEFKSQLARRNLRPQYERVYSKDDFSSFLSIAQELERQQVQAVFFPDNLLAASRFFSSVSPQYLQRIKIIGSASWDDPVQIARYSSMLNGAIFISPFFAASQREAIKQFIAIYSERYKSQPDFLAAQGYDAGILVLRAFREMLTYNIPFESALYKQYDFEGLTGRMSVAPNGEVKRRYAIVEFIEGQIRELPAESQNPSIVMHGNSMVNVTPPNY